jgi:hypothetical protein
MTESRKNLGWLWYFIIVFGLSITAAVIIAVYNLRQQLKPEQLATAEQLWKQRGPANYVMVYTIKTDSIAGTRTDDYVVKVRSGRAYEALVNGLPQEQDRLVYYGMTKLFEYIDTFLEKDAEPGKPKVFSRALFDPDTGALRWYVRRVMGTADRVEITVESLEIQDVK